MKYLVYGLLFFTGYGIAYGLMPMILPQWLSVDLILVLIICVGLAAKDYRAAIIGVISGAVVDVFIAPAFGLNVIIYGLTGYFSAMIGSKLKSNGIVLSGILTFVFYILKDIAYMLYGLIYGVRFSYFSMFLRMSLPSALLNSVISVVLYVLIRKLHELHCLKGRRQIDLLGGYKEEKNWMEEWFEQYR